MKWNVFKQKRITFSEFHLWISEVAEERGPALNYRGTTFGQEGRTFAYIMEGTSADPALLWPSSCVSLGTSRCSMWSYLRGSLCLMADCMQWSVASPATSSHSHEIIAQRTIQITTLTRQSLDGFHSQTKITWGDDKDLCRIHF